VGAVTSGGVAKINGTGVVIIARDGSENACASCGRTRVVGAGVVVVAGHVCVELAGRGPVVIVAALGGAKVSYRAVQIGNVIHRIKAHVTH
jgi:hypothetical protein